MEELSSIMDKKMRERLLKELLSMNAEEFIEWTEKLLEKMKFEVIDRSVEGEKISVTGRYKGKNYFAVVERKPAGELVGPEELQSVVGQKYKGELCLPLHICTSDYTDEAKTYAEMVGISLVNSEKLSRLFKATGLMTDLTSWRDKAIIEEEGNRWLPSAGELMGYMEEGQALFERRKYKEAMQIFQRAAQLKPSYDAAWRMIGACYHQLGDYHSAMDFYKTALSHDETDETYYLMGVTMYELGRYEDEIAYYKKALEINPKNIRALNNMGTTLYTLHRFDDALACYDRVLEIDRKDEKVWNNRGVTLKKLGRADEALKSFDRAIELRRDYMDAWINKAALHHELGQFREAAESWYIVTSQTKDKPEIWFRQGEALFNIGQYSLTIGACDEAIRLQSDFRGAIELREKALKALEREGDTDLSPPFGSLYPPLQKEEEASEMRPLARGELGPAEQPAEDTEPEEMVAETSPEPEKAELPEESEPVVDLFEEETEEEMEPAAPEPARLEAAEQEVESPEIQEPVEVVEKTPVPSARKTDAGEFMSRHVLEERAVVLLRLGRTEEATEIMLKLADVEESPQYENRLASLLFETGDIDSAMEHLELALHLDPSYYPAIYNMAYLQGIKENYEDEIELLSSVPERDFRLDLRLSLALIKNGKEADGVAVMEETAERIGSEYLWNRIGVALMEKDPEKAGEAFEKALVINPRFHQAWNNRAVLLYREGDMNGSLKYVNRSLKLRPDYGPAWITRGLILQASSKPDEALESFREAHILLNNKYSAGNLAFSQLSAGDARAALKTCLEAFEGHIGGMDAACWNLLGLILMNLGHLDSAEVCFKKAIAISPEFDEAVRNLGGLSLLEDVKKQRLGRYSSRLKEIINNAFPEDEELSEGKIATEGDEETGEAEKETEGGKGEAVEADTDSEEYIDSDMVSDETMDREGRPAETEGEESADMEGTEEQEGTVSIHAEDPLSDHEEIADAEIGGDEFDIPDDYLPLAEEEPVIPPDGEETNPLEDTLLSRGEESAVCPRCGAVGSLVDGVCLLCGYEEGEEAATSREEFSEEVLLDDSELKDVEDVSPDLEDLVEYARGVEAQISDEIEEPALREEDSQKERKGYLPDESAVTAKRKEVETQLFSLPKSELTDMCRKRGIPTAGTKKDLVLRLSPAMANEWKEMTDFLTSVPGVSARKAQNIIDVGFSSPKLIKKASVEELSALKGIGPATAKKIREAAKKL